MASRIVLALTCIVGVATPALQARAATRRVCFDLSFADDRTDCAEETDPGARRPCRPFPSIVNPAAEGHVFEIWDRDDGDGAGDDYIGTWTVGAGGSGTQICADFEWEFASYSSGEENPDPYIKYTNIVRSTSGSSSAASIRKANNSIYPPVWWRVFEYHNCYNGDVCYIAPGTILLPANDTSTDYGTAVNILDSAQHMFEIYHSHMDPATVWMEYPSNEPNCPSSCAHSRTLINIVSGYGLIGTTTVHELGHVLQMLEFNQDDLRDWLINDNWTFESFEHETGATTEGWASYVAAVSWWSPHDDLSLPTIAGFSIEGNTPVDPTCANNRWIPGQVARAFWDLDDSRNENAGTGVPSADVDQANYTTLGIASGWDDFTDGSANHQDFENNNAVPTGEGVIDIDAVNLRDYQWWKNLDAVTLFNHNCLQAQSNN